MAVTIDQMLEAIDDAIRRGVTEVRYADGRAVRYPTLEALLAARRQLVLEREQAISGDRPRTTYAVVRL